MRIRPVFRVAILCAGCAFLAPAQTKVAIINTQAALLETADMKKAQNDMQAKFKPRQDQMDKLSREIQQISQQLQTLAGKLNAQGEAELQSQGARKQKDLTRLQEDLQSDVDRERQDILSRAGTKMQAVIQKLAEEKGIDIVVDIGNTVYAKPALDISKEATAAYDKAHPAK